MKAFEFVAFNSSGKKELGMVKAWSLSGAKRKIQKRGFYLASIRTQDSSIFHSQNPFSFFKELKELFFPKKRIHI
jgi:type II secretory pathway component PulF